MHLRYTFIKQINVEIVISSDVVCMGTKVASAKAVTFVSSAGAWIHLDWEAIQEKDYGMTSPWHVFTCALCS